MKLLSLAAVFSGTFLLVSGQKYPSKTWERATPEEQGLSSAKLAEAFAYAGGEQGRNSYCASVHRNGFLLRDEYWGTMGGSLDTSIVWSISKAITSTLFGVAERDGFLETDELAAKYIKEWRDNAASNVTIDMLLRHDSGRYYDPVTDFVLSQLQRSQTDFAIGLRQRHDPGTVYQYNQMGIQNLERVLTVSLNETVNAFAKRELIDILGFESDASFMEKSILLPIANDPLLYGGFWASCHDLARFGTLWLHRGIWEDHTVFTDDFFEKGTTLPASPRPGRRYHWGSGPNYRASGMGGQMVVFNPEKQLIMTRLGGPLGLGFSSSTFVNMVMESLIDGDVGSWDYERDQVENASPLEEIQLAEFLREAGVVVSDRGEIKPLDIQGWYEMKL